MNHHTCLVGESVCHYCTDLYPAGFEELGARVWRAIRDEERRIHGGTIWLKARASGGEWADDPLFWRSIGYDDARPYRIVQ